MSENRYREMDDRFSKFMFGERHHRDDHRPDEEINTEMSSKADSDIPNWELMENIDQILTTLSSLKPLVKKVTPYIEKFISKNN